MIGARIPIAAIIVVLLTVDSCRAISSFDQVSAPNETTFITIKFPDAWTQPDADGGTTILTGPTQYAVKKNPDTAKAELFITLKWGSDEAKEWTDDKLKVQKDVGITNLIAGSYSQQLYGLSLKEGVKLRQVGLSEWEQAGQVLKSRHQIINPQDLPLKNDLTYEGKTYTKSGDTFGRVAGLMSPDGKWLVVFSYTTTGKQRPPLIPWLSGGPFAGDLFLDLYDISSGERKASAKSAYDGISPSVFFSEAMWIENKYFIMPTDGLSQTCLISEVSD